MTKARHINLSNYLKEQVAKHTKAYACDLELDLDRMKTLFQLDNSDAYFYVMVREAGTYAFRVRDVFLKNTFQNIAWTTYASPSYGYIGSIHAFLIHITGIWGGDLFGHVREISYPDSVMDVELHAVSAGTCTYMFQDGTEVECPADCPKDCACIPICEKVQAGNKLLKSIVHPAERASRFEKLVQTRQQAVQ